MRPILGSALSLSVPIVASVAILLTLSSGGALPASGSGYDLTFSQAPGSVSNANVDLVALSSHDPGGSNITISFTVSGTIELNGTSDPGYGYLLFVGGTTQSNFSTIGSFTNNSTAGSLLYTTPGGVGAAFIPFALSDGGSTMTFSVAKGAVGPASTFSLNANAIYRTSSAVVIGYLGSAYANSGGGGGCTSTGGCTPGSTGSGSSFPTNFLLYVGTIALVVVIVAVITGVLLLRRSPRPPGPTGPGGWYPGGPMPPPPPPPQGMPPPPPPPTP